MFSPDTYRWLADAVLGLHVAVVLFIVLGLAAIFCGAWRGWAWVRGWAFRLAHLGAIVYVAAQAWLGIACPLTVLESWLRFQARQGVYQRGFIEDWLQRLLYWQAPPWAFVLLYNAFAAVVMLAWWRVPPGRVGFSRAGKTGTA